MQKNGLTVCLILFDCHLDFFIDHHSVLIIKIMNSKMAVKLNGMCYRLRG